MATASCKTWAAATIHTVTVTTASFPVQASCESALRFPSSFPQTHAERQAGIQSWTGEGAAEPEERDKGTHT